MNLPIPYDVQNVAKASFSPSTFHLADNASFGFYARYLWQKMINVFKFTIPPEWDEDYFKYVLFGMGYLPVLYTNEFGVIPQYGVAGGFNQFFEPDEEVTALSRRLLKCEQENIKQMQGFL